MHHPTLPGYADVLDPADDLATHPLLAEARHAVNRALRGRVVVDYDARTVVFKNVDGAHAIRLLALVHEHDDGEPASTRWSDQLDPRTADAGSRWISFRPQRVLSIRWFPERMLIADDAHRDELELAIKLLDLIAAGSQNTHDQDTAEGGTEESDGGDTSASDDSDDDQRSNVVDPNSPDEDPPERASPPPISG